MFGNKELKTKKQSFYNNSCNNENSKLFYCSELAEFRKSKIEWNQNCPKL